jgi:hypothetical protein
MLVDCMTPRNEVPEVIRMVVGKRGQVRMKMELVIRFDYSFIVVAPEQPGRLDR